MRENYYALIMAGGKGERLWPLSRTKNPKPFIDILGEPLIKLTYKRLKKVIPEQNIAVIVPSYLKTLVKRTLPKVKILVEPAPKNTAATCVYGTYHFYRKNKNAVIGIFPADHVISKEDVFKKTLLFAFENTDNDIVTFGIKPSRPETGYGYIEIGERILRKNGLEMRNVIKFHEKPEKKLAIKYLKKGNFLWNSGMFVWKAESFLEILKNSNQEFYKNLKYLEKKDVKEFFKRIPETSVDYAVLERTNQIRCAVSKFVWEDLGSFLSFENVLEKDKEGNSKVGDVSFVESKGNIGFSKNKKIIFFRTQDLVLVDTDDITLVFPKSESQGIKELLKILKKKLNKKYF